MKIKDVQVAGPKVVKDALLKLPKDEVFTTEEFAQKIKLPKGRMQRLRNWLKSVPECCCTVDATRHLYVGHPEAIVQLRRMYNL